MKFDIYENNNYITSITANNKIQVLKILKQSGIRRQSNIIQIKEMGDTE